MGNISCLHGKASSLFLGAQSLGERRDREEPGVREHQGRNGRGTEMEWRAGSGREVPEKTEQWGPWPGFRVKCVGQGSRGAEGES